MLHPVINQIGVDTQNEVVKEEKIALWQQSLWTNDSGGKEKCSQNIPYRWTTIGSMDHLDAKLEEGLQ
jgi:hypothetical protein